jgi:transcriptional regulator with XRE-family HTH domain
MGQPPYNTHIEQYNTLYKNDHPFSEKSRLFTGFFFLPFFIHSHYYKTMDYSINDRLKQARLALNLSQRAFAQGVFLKSAGYYGDIETRRIEVNERIIELVSSIYGVNKVWLRTGKGQMFDKKIDSQLEEMTILFNQLNTHFKGYVLAQTKQLVKLQNIKNTEKKTGS